MISIDYFKNVCCDTLGVSNCRFEYIRNPKPEEGYLMYVQCWFKDNDGQLFLEERNVANIFLYEDGTSLVCIRPYASIDCHCTKWRFEFKRLMKKHTVVYRKYGELIASIAKDFKDKFRNTEESIYYLFKMIYDSEWPPAAYQMAERLLETMRLRDRKSTIEGDK